MSLTLWLAHPAFRPKMSLAHPDFRPKMSLCHRVASVVCPQFTKNASPPSILIRFYFCLVCLKERGPVY